MLKFNYLLFTPIFLLLAGCNSTYVATEPAKKKAPIEIFRPSTLTLVNLDDFDVFHHLADVNTKIPSPDEIFTLDEEEQNRFFTFINDPKYAHIPGHKRLYRYLDRRLDNFNYYADTYTAQQTIDLDNGNCMSLAVLTTAYARLLNIDLQYNEVSSPPVYDMDGSFEMSSKHVVTRLYDPDFVPERNRIYFVKPHITVDYFPTRSGWVGNKISKDNFIALFYRNLAGEKLTKGDYYGAAQLAIESLKYDESEPETINMMAVIYRHAGYADKAEALYRHGISYDKKSLNLLHNYQVLLYSQNRPAEAKGLQQAIDELDDPSPFPYLILANDAYKKGAYNRALKYYNKTIEKAHYLPHGYVGAAKAYYAKGQNRLAREHLRKAIERTHDRKEERLYQAKLASITYGEVNYNRNNR